MKTTRISRVLRIITTIQSGQCYTLDALSNMLDVSRRTVFRDLEQMKKAGIPCHCDRKTCCYSINPEFLLPPMNLNSQEALSLLLLVKARDLIHIPFGYSFLQATLKIAGNLPEKIRQSCDTILRNISIRANPQIRSDFLNDILVQLFKAILKKQVVNIHYYSPQERKAIVTDLSTYHLRYGGNTWHVIGKSTFHNRVHAFRLNQIKELKLINKCFIEDKEFDINDYLGRAWSTTPECMLYHVKLKFLPEVAHSVAEVRWHSTQTVTFGEDGSAIIEFHVDGVNEIIWWVLSYGDKVQVLAPRILRKRIAEIANNMLQNAEWK